MANGTDDTTVIDNPADDDAVNTTSKDTIAQDTTANADPQAVSNAADDEGSDESTIVNDDAARDESDSNESGSENDSFDDQSDEDSADNDADDDDDDDDDENPLEVEGEIAADYLEELLDIADLDGDIDTYVENDRAHVSVITESDVLVGENGEVLEALQELSRLAVITETGNRSRLMLDVGGFREARRQELTKLAAEAVADVKSNGESVRLKPMNPFERKIVHDAVAAAGLSSASEGEEPQRRVVVQPAE